MYCSNGQVMPSSLSGVDQITLKAEKGNIPLNAMLELTYRCNVDCVHCYCQHLDEPAPRRELTTAEWIDALDQLAEMGAFYLTLTGGEIFMRPDFWEIAFHAKKRHYAITLFTNGTMITEKVADRLAELRPVSIEMSLLHSEEAKHDLLAKKPGSYKKILNAARLLKERNISFVLKTTLMKQNASAVEEIHAQGMGAGARRVSFATTFAPRNDGSLSPLASAPTLEQLREFFLAETPLRWNPIVEMPQEVAHGKGTCGAATTSIAINPYGDILPCIQLLLSFGNLREKSIREAWENPPPALQGVRHTQTYGALPECNGCELISYCNRCHGLALLETGRWNSKYKQACEHAALSKEVNDIYQAKGETDER